MRVATVSCREDRFEIERDKLYNVNDIAGSWCFGSRIHLPLNSDVHALKDYDAVWFTMSKQVRPYEKRWMEMLYEFKSKWPNKKVILHQEAEVEFYLTHQATGWNVTKGWMEVLYDKVDLLLAHNGRDNLVYKYFVDHGTVQTWRTVQDVDQIISYRKDPSEKGKVVGVSTYDGRANGTLALAVVSKLTKNIMQITRSEYQDDRNTYVNKRFSVLPKIAPLCGWFDWLENITDLYMYVHPMPAASAGRDTIACAALGIPVIGNKNLNAQVHLFPDLAVEAFDTRGIEHAVQELLGNPGFYDRVRRKALAGFEYYGIEHGVERAKEIMNLLGWK